MNGNVNGNVMFAQTLPFTKHYRYTQASFTLM